jgi:hypothetical protein
MSTLQRRIQAFLERPLPDEVALNHAPDSMTEIFLRTYAGGERMNSGLVNIGKVCLAAMDPAIAALSTEAARAYFVECRELLVEVLQEVM